MNKVLIVEDDPALRDVYKEALLEEGFDCDTAATGSEALSKAQTYAPSVILLDIMLPGGMNGFDIAEQLKKNSATFPIPIIFLTNLDSEKQSAMAIGASDYIVKSNASIPEIIEKINHILASS